MKKTLALASLLAATGAVNAATISYSDSYGLATTDWAEDLTLSQFDPTLGTLLSVLFDYSGQVDTLIKVESLDAAPAVVTGESSADISFDDPIFDTLNISSTNSIALGVFDGAIDFAGPSGYDFGTITGVDAGSLTLTTGLASYIGTGTYNIAVAAEGLSNASGAGNLISQINTTAYADITVTYTYDEVQAPTVPEPATLTLLGVGLLGLGRLRRRA